MIILIYTAVCGYINMADNSVKAQGGGAWNPLCALTLISTIHQSAKRTADSAKRETARRKRQQQQRIRAIFGTERSFSTIVLRRQRN